MLPDCFHQPQEKSKGQSITSAFRRESIYSNKIDKFLCDLTARDLENKSRFLAANSILLKLS